MIFSLIHATRGRPQQAIATKREWYEKAVWPGSVEHIFGIDSDDEETVKVMTEFRGDTPHAMVQGGGTTPKATNAAAKISVGNILFVIADDFYPPKYWDAILLSKLEDHLDDEWLLSIDDGCRPDELATHPILSRKRYLRQGEIFSEEYESMFADNEITWRARRDGVLFVDKGIHFQHRHPILQGRVDTDETYRRCNDQERYKRGWETFKRRNPDAP